MLVRDNFKIKTLLAMVIVVLLMTVAGCGQTTSGEEQFIGHWKLKKIVLPDDVLEGEILKQYVGDSDFFVDIKKDGKITVKAPVATDGVREMEWEVKDGKLTCQDSIGQEVYTIEDGQLVGSFEAIKFHYVK